MKRHLFYLRYVFIFGLILQFIADAMGGIYARTKSKKSYGINNEKCSLHQLTRKAKAYGACITGTCQEQES